MSTTKTCEVCHCQFKPDPRVGDRQRVCRKLSCQKERKRRSQRAWLKKNPDYFKGRYPLLKEYILPYQKRCPNKRPADRKTKIIQDKIIFINNKPLLGIEKDALTIQDKITSILLKGKRLFNDANNSDYTRQVNAIFCKGLAIEIYKTRLNSPMILCIFFQPSGNNDEKINAKS